MIKAKCGPYLKLGKPERLNQMVNEDYHTIVRTYGAQYRGWWSTTSWPATSTMQPAGNGG